MDIEEMLEIMTVHYVMVDHCQKKKVAVDIM